jgi:hypothetical protein
MLNRAILALLAGFILLAIADWESSLVCPYNMEMQEAGNGQKTSQTSRKYCATFAGSIITKSGRVVDAYHDDVTAAATAVIAIFTIVLVIVTNRQARLTKDAVRISERTLTELERAYVYVDKIESQLRMYLSPNTSWRVGSQDPQFTFSIVNFGRTAGNIVKAIIVFEVLDQIPEETKESSITSDHPDAESAEIIIGPDRVFTLPPMRCRHNFTREHARTIGAGTAHIYCHGLFIYLDIFMKSHLTKFCRKYVAHFDEWVPEGGKERNSSG